MKIAKKKVVELPSNTIYERYLESLKKKREEQMK
jgi:hypothetical protein